MTFAPLGEPLSTNLIERYLCTRGQRYFRGQHDAEFFFVLNARPRRLHVHLEISLAHPDVFNLRVAPACFFPTADHARLAQLADVWNAQQHGVTAIVHGSSDPHRVGVTGYSSRLISGPIRFEDFAAFVDRSIDAAIGLFGRLQPVAELPHTAEPLLRNAG